MALKLKVKSTSGRLIETNADPELTIFDIKAICCEELNTDPEKQTLLYKGKICDDDSTLEELEIPSGATFVVLLRRVESPNKNVQSPAAPCSPPEEEKKEEPNDNNNDNAALNSHSGLNNMMNMGLNMGSMQSMQQSLMQNPDLMKKMMESPLMKQMFSSPQLMQNLFNSSPALQQLMKDNPQLRHVLKDPSLMQHAMRAASNPEYYNEMLKNNDRALRNIESIPGGFSALSRLYNQIQKPMERAMDDIYRQRFGKSSTKITDISDKSKGPQTTPMENPWSSDFKSKQQQQMNNMNMNMNAMLQQQQQQPQMGGMDMMSLMQQMSGMMNGNAQNTTNMNQMPNANNFALGAHTNPSQLYTRQLQELRNMGFVDEQRNCNALIATGGNVAAAVQYLLDQQTSGPKQNK